MPRRWFEVFAVLVVLLLSTVGAHAQPTTLAPAELWNEGFTFGSDDGRGMGSRIAGAWLGSGQFSVDLDCDTTVDFVLSFSDVQMFGAGGSRAVTNPGNPNSGLGTWRKTGPRQISGRDISFGAGTVSIVSITVDFDRHFRTATSMFRADVYLAGVDPFDPESPLAACSKGQHTSLIKVTATE